MHLRIYGISCLFLHLFNYLFVLLFICLFIHFFIQVAWTCRMTSETSVVIAWWIEFGRVGRNLTTKVLVPKAEEQQWLRKAKTFWSGTLESYISLFRLRLAPWYSFFFQCFHGPLHPCLPGEHTWPWYLWCQQLYSRSKLLGSSKWRFSEGFLKEILGTYHWNTVDGSELRRSPPFG